MRAAFALAGLVTVALACGAREDPQDVGTGTFVEVSVRQVSVSKADVLFVVDDGPRAADLQRVLAQGGRKVLDALMRPECHDPSNPAGPSAPPDAAGQCPSGLEPDYRGLVDVHVAVLSSSLGGGGAELVGGGTCGAPSANRSARPISGSFLAWLPHDEQNLGQPAPLGKNELTPAALEDDFAALVTGLGEAGCSLPAPLESWVHFLVDPDPYLNITLDGSSPPRAVASGIDDGLLRARHDFLRPDSLVAIVQVTASEDTWTDPAALGGRSWILRTPLPPVGPGFPGSPTGTMPHATSACAEPVDPNDASSTGPGSPQCMSCAFAASSGDPQCTTDPYVSTTEDGLGVRFVDDMKRKYGFEAQFPIGRYVSALSDLQVFSTARAGACRNPLFAAALPSSAGEERCALPLGPRTKDLVYYLLVGGVVPSLLSDSSGNPKYFLSADDWKALLGRDPDHYDRTGIDPHMLESASPRAGLPPPTASDVADPVHGREWDTSKGVDGPALQAACTYELPSPRDCSDPANAPSCDCVGSQATPGGPPLCAPNPKDGGKLTLQVRAQARPSLRELRVAKALGTQAAVASVCEPSPFGAAAGTLADVLATTGDGGCFPPSPLLRDESGLARCLALVTLGPPGADPAVVCDSEYGLSQPDPEILAEYNRRRCRESKGWAYGGVAASVDCSDPAQAAVALATIDGATCVLAQVPPASDGGDGCSGPGFCYVTGVQAGGCSARIAFTPRPPYGSRVDLRCWIAQ